MTLIQIFNLHWLVRYVGEKNKNAMKINLVNLMN